MLKKKNFITYLIYEYELTTHHLTKQQFTMYPSTILNKTYIYNSLKITKATYKLP